MSTLEVNTITPQSGTTVTLGGSGDSINLASGATAGFGKIGQVIHNSSSTNLTSSSTSLSEMLNASITPSSTSSKILIHFSMNLNTTAGSVTYVKGTVLRGTISGTDLGAKIMGHGSSSDATWNLKGVYLDSPSTTSAQQYTLGCLGS